MAAVGVGTASVDVNRTASPASMVRWCLTSTADVQTRLDEGIAFEASVVNELRAVAGSDWVFVDQTASPGLQVEATDAGRGKGGFECI